MGDGSADEASPGGAGRTGRAVVPARAALAGNPSDGYGGAVVAVPLPCFAAVVTARFDHRAAVGRDGPGDELADLVAATLDAAVRLAEVPRSVAERVVVEVATTIPRSVGLAGSSAISIGVLRAFVALAPSEDWSARLRAPEALAVVARSAEVDGLGIAAGLQDRLVQAHGRPVHMEFGDADDRALGRPCGRSALLPDPPGTFVLAHRAGASESSGVVHRRLADRADHAPTMEALASAARAAAAAIRSGDTARLGAAMDRTFDLRAELLDLDPRHVEMVDVARRSGAHANYTGSGGAIIAMVPDPGLVERVTDALRSLDGCTVTRSPSDPNPPLPADRRPTA